MADRATQEAYDELSYYTLAHHDPGFIHQNIVDAFAAQTADRETKPIKLAFALIGLYLTVEKNYSGKQVQQTHVLLGKHHREWPIFSIPEKTGEINVFGVSATPPGEERDEMIKRWCVSVWSAYSASHETIKELLEQVLD